MQWAFSVATAVAQQRRFRREFRDGWRNIALAPSNIKKANKGRKLVLTPVNVSNLGVGVALA
jgi:hypothetical protein